MAKKGLKRLKIAFFGEFWWFLREILTIFGGIFPLIFMVGGWELTYFEKKKKIPPSYGPERADKAENGIFGGILVILGGNFPQLFLGGTYILSYIL